MRFHRILFPVLSILQYFSIERPEDSQKQIRNACGKKRGEMESLNELTEFIPLRTFPVDNDTHYNQDNCNNSQDNKYTSSNIWDGKGKSR